jgi:DNA recombination protein Rad52
MSDNSPFTEDQIMQLKAPLPPESIAQREGPGGKMLDYIKGWRAIDTANKIFGFGQWGLSVLGSHEVSRESVKFKRRDGSEVEGWEVLYTATVALQVHDCIQTQDVGYGSGKFESLGDAIELATKEAVTDAMKRAFRHFGDQFGNGLYDAKKHDHIAVDLDGLRESIMSLRALPELQGSDKQIWSAKKVRDAVMTVPIAQYHGLDGLAAQVESRPDEPKLLGFAALCLEDRAKFWLDNVERTGKSWSDIAPDSLITLVGKKVAELGLEIEPEPEREPGDESEGV